MTPDDLRERADRLIAKLPDPPARWLEFREALIAEFRKVADEASYEAKQELDEDDEPF